MDKPPFDVERAAFWLVACVIGVYGAVIVTGLVLCSMYYQLVVEGRWVCDRDSRLTELLAAALAAALAFSGRRNKEK